MFYILIFLYELMQIFYVYYKMEGWKIKQDHIQQPRCPKQQLQQQQQQFQFQQQQQIQPKWLIQNIDYTNANYRPINSQSVIRNFHRENKQTQRAHVYDKKQLQDEVRKTTFKLKVKKFKKNINLRAYVNKYEKGIGNRQQFYSRKQGRGSNVKQKQNISIKINQIEDANENEKNDKYKIEHFNTFNEFIIKKRSENMHIKNKMKIFCNSITDRSRAKIQREINTEIIKLQHPEQSQPNKQAHNTSKPKPQRLSCIPIQQTTTSTTKNNNNILLGSLSTEKQTNRTHKIKQYTISHMILDKLLRIMIQNPKYITLKHEHSQIYQQMKQEMLDLIINNDRISSSIEMLENQMKLQDNSMFKFSRNKLKTIQICRKPFYLLKQQKKDELAQQINTILQTLKDIVEQAFINFNKPEQAYHLQQYWQHREGNNTTIQKSKKLNKTQNCLRTTTIQRFRQTKQN